MSNTPNSTETRKAEDIIGAYQRGERPAIEAHPAASCFPLMTDKRLKELAASIKDNGLLHALVLTPAGLLLDGRNRLRACEMVDVEPRFHVWQGGPGGEIAYVLSANETRRAMSEAQRAMAGARLSTLSPGRPKSADVQSLSQATIAKMLRVSVRAIGMAAKIINDAPEVVIGFVEKGQLSLRKGEAIAKKKNSVTLFDGKSAKQALTLAKTFQVDKGPQDGASAIASVDVSGGVEHHLLKVAPVLETLRLCLQDDEQRHAAGKWLNLEQHAEVKKQLAKLLQGPDGADFGEQRVGP